jgi:chromosome segregation ATPase
MTERLDRIEASLQATANICGSNARAIQANGEQIGELRNTVDAFIQKLDDEGLRVTLVTQMADDMGGDVSYLESEKNRQDASIAALREDAIADRAEFRTQAEADRQAFRESLESDRAEWRASFEAQQEIIQRLLLEIRSTNGEVRQLGDRVDNLEQAS